MPRRTSSTSASRSASLLPSVPRKLADVPRRLPPRPLPRRRPPRRQQRARKPKLLQRRKPLPSIVARPARSSRRPGDPPSTAGLIAITRRRRTRGPRAAPGRRPRTSTTRSTARSPHPTDSGSTPSCTCGSSMTAPTSAPRAAPRSGRLETESLPRSTSTGVTGTGSCSIMARSAATT